MMNSTTNTVSTTTTFDFRSKFRKFLNGENISVIEDGFNAFCHMSPDSARKLLWNLTYRQDPTYSLEKLGIDSTVLPSEALPAFRNELRYQYEMCGSILLDVDLPAHCRVAFDKLVGRSNLFTAGIVFDQSLTKMFAPAEVLSKVLSLLESDKESLYFGGLREIGFSYEETNYLKAFHQEVFGLFKAMYEHYRELPSKKLATPASPFAGLDKRLDEEGFKLSPDAPASTETQLNIPKADEVQPVVEEEVPNIHPNPQATEPAVLTVANILKHQEAFTSLMSFNEAMELLQKLRAYGFNLNEIVEKAAKIKALLESANDLSN